MDTEAAEKARKEVPLEEARKEVPLEEARTFPAEEARRWFIARQLSFLNRKDTPISCRV